MPSLFRRGLADLFIQNGLTMKMKLYLQLCITAIIFLLLNSVCFAGSPVWTFTPDPYYPPTISITPDGSATIRYVVTNQSHKPHTLMMTPVAGITQVTSAGDCPNPFTLNYKQSCTLNLLVNGSELTQDVRNGPTVCQLGNTLQCYQPAATDILNITRVPYAEYIITPTAGSNGSITPSTSQTVSVGANLNFTATPNSTYHVDKWIVDGGVAQIGGTTFTLSNISANHSIEVTFTPAGSIYAGTASGLVYVSNNNGASWTSTTTPSPGSAANGIFANTNTLYVGSADGKVYYSIDNGTIWNATTAVPGSTAITSIFVASISSVTTMYVGTQNGKVYHSVDGSSWTATTSDPGSGAVNSIFITPANTIYVGSNNGNVYYSTNLGSSWNTINGPTLLTGLSIQNVFATSTQLYINTRHISSDSTLPAGTVDFEYAFTSNSLTNPNPTWSLLSQISYTLFVNADASVIHAGTQDGYVYSITTGDELGFITYSPINSLFFLA